MCSCASSHGWLKLCQKLTQLLELLYDVATHLVKYPNVAQVTISGFNWWIMITFGITPGQSLNLKDKFALDNEGLL
jgi:hypothetical protein